MWSHTSLVLCTSIANFVTQNMFLYASFQKIVNALTETHSRNRLSQIHISSSWLSVIKNSHGIFEPVKIIPLQCLSAQLLSRVQLFAIPWTVAYQAPVSMGFPRDGGAWWAAIYEVAQSQTQLKWLSSKINPIKLLTQYLANWERWGIEIHDNEWGWICRYHFPLYISLCTWICNLIKCLQSLPQSCCSTKTCISVSLVW